MENIVKKSKVPVNELPVPGTVLFVGTGTVSINTRFDFVSIVQFVPWDVLSRGTFCPCTVLICVTFLCACTGTFEKG